MQSALHLMKVRGINIRPSSPIRSSLIGSGSQKSLLFNNKFVLENVISKNTTSRRQVSNYIDATSRFWSYRKKWIHEGTNPFEVFEPKDPDPAPIGTQTDQDQLIAEQELGATRNIRIYIPESFNPINKHLAVRLNNLFAKYERNRIVTSVTLQGYDQAFCTGMDLAYVYKHRDSEETKAFLKSVYQMAYSAATMSKPLVTLHDGISLGVGNALFVHGAVRVATEKGIFAIRDTELGWFPDGGITYHLARHPIKGMGMYLALTGTPLYGADLCHANLATHFVRESLLGGFRATLATSYPNISKLERFLVNVNDGAEFFDDREYTQMAYLPAITRCFSKETLPEIIQALKDDGSGWAFNCLQKINSSDPVAILITFRLMKLAQGIGMQDLLKVEYAIAQEILKYRDIYEGIECTVLNDPPKIPKWRYESISQVPESVIDKYFDQTGKEVLEVKALSDNPIRPIIAERMEEIIQDKQEEVRMTKEEFNLRQRLTPTMLQILTPLMESVNEESDEMVKQTQEKSEQFQKDLAFIASALVLRRVSEITSQAERESEELTLAYKLPAPEAAKRIAKLRQHYRLRHLQLEVPRMVELFQDVEGYSFAEVYKLSQLSEEEILKYAEKEILQTHLSPYLTKKALVTLKKFTNEIIPQLDLEERYDSLGDYKEDLKNHLESLKKKDAELLSRANSLPEMQKKALLLAHANGKFEEKYELDMQSYIDEKSGRARTQEEVQKLEDEAIAEYSAQTAKQREDHYFNYFKELYFINQKMNPEV